MSGLEFCDEHDPIWRQQCQNEAGHDDLHRNRFIEWGPGRCGPARSPEGGSTLLPEHIVVTTCEFVRDERGAIIRSTETTTTSVRYREA